MPVFNNCTTIACSPQCGHSLARFCLLNIDDDDDDDGDDDDDDDDDFI